MVNSKDTNLRAPSAAQPKKIDPQRANADQPISNSQVQSVLEFAAVGIYFTDLQGRCTYANRACVEFLGYTSDEDILHQVVHDIAHHSHADGSEYPISECKIYCAFQDGERSHVNDEVFWRADGSSFPVEYWSHPIIENNKPVGAVVSFMDISERAAVESTKELLIAELAHRVKNMLATIKAIASQTMRRESDPEKFAPIFAKRIDAMAQAHSLLTQTQWKGASLIEVLRTQLAIGGHSRDGLIQMRGPDVRLTTHMTINLAMTIHELGTNAAKYGVLSKPSGTILLDWTVVKTEEGHRLKLTWKEHGGPTVSEPTRKGFGTTLIERSLLGSHGSRVEQVFEPDGLRCNIDILLAEVK